jgi:hypothetical protein
MKLFNHGGLRMYVVCVHVFLQHPNACVCSSLDKYLFKLFADIKCAAPPPFIIQLKTAITKREKNAAASVDGGG